MLTVVSISDQGETGDSVIRNVGQIPLPVGFTRADGHDPAFTRYLRSIAISTNPTVYLFNGKKKFNQRAQYVVLDVSVGDRDLQQCADAVIRLRCEYLWASNRKDEIAFHFTSGHLAKWTEYSKGYRPKIEGNKVTWVLSANPDSSRASFDRYLQLIFTYCGTYSLHKELKVVNDPMDIQPGDVFIQTGDPYGHAVIVMDVAVSADGDKIFSLAQSYMPAQSIHVLRNPELRPTTPWFEVQKSGSLRTPEWTFEFSDLRRF